MSFSLHARHLGAAAGALAAVRVQAQHRTVVLIFVMRRSLREVGALAEVRRALAWHRCDIHVCAPVY